MRTTILMRKMKMMMTMDVSRSLKKLIFLYPTVRLILFVTIIGGSPEFG